MMLFSLSITVIAILEWRIWLKQHTSTQRLAFRRRMNANLGLGSVIVLLSSTEQFVVDFIGLDAQLSLFSATLVGMGFGVQMLSYLLLSTFLSYWAHRASHYFPMLWRLHGVHHSDLTVTASTSLRHHPGEILITAPFFAVALGLLHFDPEPVVVTTFFMSTVSAWVHTDQRLPEPLERFAWFLPMPALHRLHHERAWYESNHNFSQSFPLWDVIFKTYLPPPPRDRDTDYGDETLGSLSAVALFESAFTRKR